MKQRINCNKDDKKNNCINISHHIHKYSFNLNKIKIISTKNNRKKRNTENKRNSRNDPN